CLRGSTSADSCAPDTAQHLPVVLIRVCGVADLPIERRKETPMFVTGRHRLLIAALVALLASTGVTGAGASPATSASGTFTYTSSTFNNVRQAGGNTIIDLSATVSYTGTLNGNSTLHGTLIFHPD